MLFAQLLPPAHTSLSTLRVLLASAGAQASYCGVQCSTVLEPGPQSDLLLYPFLLGVPQDAFESFSEAAKSARGNLDLDPDYIHSMGLDAPRPGSSSSSGFSDAATAASSSGGGAGFPALLPLRLPGGGGGADGFPGAVAAGGLGALSGVLSLSPVGPLAVRGGVAPPDSKTREALR